MLGEDVLAGKPMGLTKTPDEAIIEINTMKADLKGPLFDLSHPQHKEFVEKWTNLHKMAYPEGQ